MNHFSLAAEVLATATGLLGAWYVADDGRRAGWGFALFLASNAGWILFGWINGHWGLVAQQVGFTALSARGIWKKLLRDQCSDLRWMYRMSRMAGRSRWQALRWALDRRVAP